jgi:hypothetical protein
VSTYRADAGNQIVELFCNIAREQDTGIVEDVRELRDEV